MIGFQLEARHEGFGIPRRSVRGHATDRRTALRDGAMKQPLRRGHAEERAHLAGATRLPEDRHVVRIAAEVRDVVANPLEACDDVAHAGVAGVGVLLAAEPREMDEPERVHAVGDADHDDVVTAREIRTVIRDRAGRSARITPAVQPRHDWTSGASRGARRPDVQVQAVFTHRLAARERLPLGNIRGLRLRRTMTERERLAHAGPGRNLERREEASRPRRRRAERHTLERVDAIDEQPANLSRRRLDDGAGRAG